MTADSALREGVEHAAPFDALLSDAALGPVRRWLPGAAGVRLVRSLAARPDAVRRRVGELAGELTRVAAGTSELEPDAKDKRFSDPAWRSNPLLHRLVQAYLAGGRTAFDLVEDAGLDWRDGERVRFLAENLVAALAPSNVPVLNPTAVRAAVDSGGQTFVRGAGNLVRDLREPPRVPSMVDPTAFEVGRNLAVTPGSVVLRTPILELIQYAPSTERVREAPLLVVPPTINRYYIVDLAPGRSMVEHFLDAGQQVFLISWRNPGAEHADWGFDAYVRAILDALDAVRRISGAEQAALLGLCSGGILSALAAGHLAATGQSDRLAGFALGVTVLDQARAGSTSALMDRETAEAAAASSARQGYLDGRSLAEVFAWLRPNDLVWSYWVNNYLLGKDPPAFDVLFWNADTTRMAARLHRDFLELALDNALVVPKRARVLGTPVDLSQVAVDSYVVAGISDHLCPWESCYRSTQLLGGASRFVLSTSGHVVALVNPPGNPKASFRTNEASPPDPAEWIRTAQVHPGTWWPDFTEWLAERCGPEKDAPERLGGPGLEPLGPAPGSYVRET